MFKNTEDISAPDLSKGLNTQLNVLAVTKQQSPNMIDVRVNYDGSLEKRLGSNTQNAIILSNSAGAGFSPDSANSLSTSLSSYWKLDETSGNRKDFVGGIDLSDSGNTVYSSGIRNQAALFNASTGQALYSTDGTKISRNGNFSFSSWIYLNSTSTTLQRTILSKKDLAQGGNLVTLLHMDGADGSTTITDSELTPKTWTASGNAQIKTNQSKFGGASARFDGTNSYISTTNSTDFDFGTGDFTIDFWMRFNTTATSYFFNRGNGTTAIFWNSGLNVLDVYINNSAVIAYNWTPNSAQWYHIAVSRQGTNLQLFIDGVSVSSVSNSSSISDNASFLLGFFGSGPNYFDGWIDEFRILKGLAAYTATFTPPTTAYSNPSTQMQFQYWLYVDTDNKVVFDVSSSGTTANGSVRSNSFGTLTTSTWYNTVAWYDSSNSIIGVSVNLATNSASYTNGVMTNSAPFTVGALSGGAGMFFDGRVDETAYWTKALIGTDRTNLYNSGSSSSYNSSFVNWPWASFDFGASSLRWLTVAAGTGLYASSNLGVTFVTFATDRTATYQYLDRSKNVLVATSEAYDTPLAWSGSAGTYATILNNSAPSCKYNINFQGFLILLNSSTRKRGFFYNDENTQLTGAWTNNFDIPSSADDEITSAFVLRRYLYVSTRYKIFRISYVGGNPDWSFTEIKNWGFVPRTAKKIILTNNSNAQGGVSYSIGEVVMGLTWDRKVKIFDGSGDQIISNNIERDNSLCEFAIEKISYLGSGPIVSFAETNPNENVYKLCVSIGPTSDQTTHFINYDGRAFGWYPYSNMHFNCMCMAESANQRFLMAFDRSGLCHMMDSGNLDGNQTIISEQFDSPVIFNKSPSQSTKGKKIDFFFSNTTSGEIKFYDRIDFSNSFNLRRKFVINGSTQKISHYESIDISETFNTYQFRITASDGTQEPWRLQRWDFFNQGLGIGRNE